MIYATRPSADTSIDRPVTAKISIVGGGIIGAFESYYAYKEAEKNGQRVCIAVYEKGASFGSTNTAYNVVPCLTFDEILHVVPSGPELVEKLAHHFSHSGGIRVDDIPNLNESEAAVNFKNAAYAYGFDEHCADRTESLFQLGKKSMELWQALYVEADEELKGILRESSFASCHEVEDGAERRLHNGYQLELVYQVPNAHAIMLGTLREYELLGYKNCALVSPDELLTLDPCLNEFCLSCSEEMNNTRVWKEDCCALWRPAGSIDTKTFLPKFYAYLKKVMGQYKDTENQLQDCFHLYFGKEVTAVQFDSDTSEPKIRALEFQDGTCQTDDDMLYIFCPGESVGTLNRLGFSEPAYAGFAGASLLVTIDLAEDMPTRYKDLSLSMGVQKGDVMLAWQSRCKENSIRIGAGGGKAFYGDTPPHKNDAFAKSRNLAQLNVMNDLFPDLISMACGRDTKASVLSQDDLLALEEKGIAHRWVGRRAVAYDGYPTIGALYHNTYKVKNARCTTHLGSGGVSFAPGAVYVSRSSEKDSDEPLVQKILTYADSGRS